MVVKAGLGYLEHATAWCLAAEVAPNLLIVYVNSA